MLVWLKEFLGDRIQINSLLIVLCFVSVLALSSQSAASYPSYLLAISMLLTFRRWDDVTGTPLFWLVAAVLGYLWLTSFWSTPFTWRGAFGMLGRVMLVLLFVVAMAECQLRGLVQRWLARALAVVGSISAAAAIFEHIVNPNSHGRLFGLGQLDNPVVAALVFGAVAILVLHMLIGEPRPLWKVVAMGSLSMVIVAIYLTGSRNSWVSIVLAGVVLFLAHQTVDRQHFLAGVAAIAVLVGVAIAALLLNETSREWLLPRGDSFRLEIWGEVLGVIREKHLLFGAGILTPDQVAVGSRDFAHPHNMYLAVLFQGGVIGLGLFLSLTIAVLKVLLLRFESDSAKLALGLLTLALASYLLDGHELIDKVGETWFLYWLPVGLSVGIAWNDFVELRD